MDTNRTPLIFAPALKKSPLFEDLSALEQNAISAFLEPFSVKKGDVIFDEGAAGEDMFILLSGKLSAWVHQADKSQQHIFDIKPGDFFGEMSIIANESRSATIIAIVDSQLLMLHGIDFFRIIFEYPMIGVKILNSIKKVHNVWLDQISKHSGDLMRWGEAARRRAMCDDLTGLYNRRILEEFAVDYFEKTDVSLRNLSLLMIDLDKIHLINDRHGTKGGDMVLIATAKVLMESTRSGDICSRLSGDEFAILLPDTNQNEAHIVAEKIRGNLFAQQIEVPEAPNATKLAKVAVSASIGVAVAPFHAGTWEKINIVADTALHRSKSLGRNRVEMAAV